MSFRAVWIVPLSLLCSLLGSLMSTNALAASTVLRDSIGPGGSFTGAYIGAATNHNGADWSTPGMVLNVPSASQLTEVQIVIFARDENFLPENDLADVLGYPMALQIWTDGLQGGEDSFELNADVHESVTGHLSIDVNTPHESHIEIEELGRIGPDTDPELFATFLVTMDVTSFDILLQGGRQYVLGVIQDNAENFITGGGVFRQTASSVTGFEDVFQVDAQPTSLLPGYLNSQLGLGVEQWAGKITVADGDFNGDGDIDGRDFLKWQRNLGQVVEIPGTGADSIADGVIDYRDLRVWQSTLRQQSPANLTAGSQAVEKLIIPEPMSRIVLIGMGLFCVSHGRFGRRFSCVAWRT